MASPTPAPIRYRFLIPLTSGRKYACDDGYPTTVAPCLPSTLTMAMAFLARQDRQSGNRRRTRSGAAFLQQFAHKPADSRPSARVICATLAEYYTRSELTKHAGGNY